jgi:DNA-binding YbaB/EbfC family protein
VNQMKKLMEQAQKMQAQVAEMQAKLQEEEVEASAGGGSVKAVVNGRHELVSITILPEAVDPEDVEMLEDLVLSAVNEAQRQVDARLQEEMAKLTGGMNLPGMF